VSHRHLARIIHRELMAATDGRAARVLDLDFRVGV
jgi:hypothetical protein